MSNFTLTPAQWTKILAFLRKCPDVRVADEEKCKRFINAVLWMARGGTPWRMLPKEYGKWNTIYKRFVRWADKGVWRQMHEFFMDDPDMKFILIDSTIVRAHHSAAGAPQKRGASPPKPSEGAGAGSARKSTRRSTSVEDRCG